MRISTAQFYQQGVSGIQRRQSEVHELVQKLSSGRAQLRPSEDPFVAARSLDLEQVVSRTRQFQENILFAEARLSLEETTLHEATSLLQRTRDLAVQANNGSLSNEDRRSIAHEIEERYAELLQLGNTVDPNGDHLFAGFRGLTEPLAARTIGSMDFVDYRGDQGRRAIQVGESRRIQDADTGDEVFFRIESVAGLQSVAEPANAGTGEAAPAYVFDPGVATGNDYRVQFTAANTYDIVDESLGVNVATGVAYVDGAAIEFDGIRTAVTGTPAAGDIFRVRPGAHQDVFTTLSKFTATLRSEVATPADQARVAAALGQSIEDLGYALDRLTEFRTRIGGRLNALESQRDENAAFELQTRNTLSDLKDLDYAEAISNLQQNLFALQAAEQSLARVEGLSLFNYL